MTVFRICNSQYSDDISGTGAKNFGARWNSKGLPMLYVTEHISLAVLEMLVHVDFKEVQIPMSILDIRLPETVEIKEIKLSKLKSNWITDLSYTRFIGDEFIRNHKDLVLKVPSAVVQEENNFLINPLHADFKKIKITQSRILNTDRRLFTVS